MNVSCRQIIWNFCFFRNWNRLLLFNLLRRPLQLMLTTLNDAILESVFILDVHIQSGSAPGQTPCGKIRNFFRSSSCCLVSASFLLTFLLVRLGGVSSETLRRWPSGLPSPSSCCWWVWLLAPLQLSPQDPGCLMVNPGSRSQWPVTGVPGSPVCPAPPAPAGAPRQGMQPGLGAHQGMQQGLGAHRWGLLQGPSSLLGQGWLWRLSWQLGTVKQQAVHPSAALVPWLPPQLEGLPPQLEGLPPQQQWKECSQGAPVAYIPYTQQGCYTHIDIVPSADSCCRCSENYALYTGTLPRGSLQPSL